MTDAPARRHNPFPGLRPFDIDQHHLFFGREQQVGQLLEVLGEHRFLAVLGPSGSGKSSLIRAGMIPRLYEGLLPAAGRDWVRTIFTPGRRVFDHFGVALQEAGLANAADVDDLRRGRRDLAEFVSTRLSSNKSLLIMVDQFEEIFRLQSDDETAADEATRFVDSLLQSVRQRDVPIYVVLTMRAEDIGHCTTFTGLAESINDVDYLVPRMSVDQLRTAIEGPVRVVEAQISDELVERVVSDIGEDVDRLPLLQHALMRTWDHWAERVGTGPLDVNHYEAVGTVSDALSQHAEEVYGDLSSDEERRLARVLFQALASGRSGYQDGRHPTTLTEVSQVADTDIDDVSTVAEHFRSAGRWFLMPPPEAPLTSHTVLDISHESLLRLWRRARTWMDEETQSAHLYTRLASTAALYQEGRAGLYLDPDLELALEWRRENRPTAAWARRYDPAFERAITFLDHSAAERDFQRATEETRRQRALRRTRMFAVFMGGVSLIFLSGLVVGLNLFFEAEEAKHDALDQRELAVRESERAEVQRLLAVQQQRATEEERVRAEQQRRIAEEQQAVAVREGERAEEQRRLAVHQQELAVRESKRAEEQRALAEKQRELADQERDRADVQRQIAVEQRHHADRLRLLSVSRSLAIQAEKIHERADQDQLAALLALQAHRFLVRHGGGAQNPAVHKALRQALGTFEDESHRTLRGHKDAVRAVAFLGERLISASDDGTVQMRDLTSESAPVLWSMSGAVRSLATSPDGHQVASGLIDGILQLAPVDAGDHPEALFESAGATVTSVSFASTGGGLAATWLDGRIALWNLDQSLATPLKTWQLDGRANSVDFSSDGQLLAVGGDTAVHLWQADGEEVTVGPPAYDSAVRSLAFSDNGQWLAAGTERGDLLLWERANLVESQQVLIGHRSAITSLEFHPDSGLLASASLDGTVRLWDVTAPEQEPVSMGHDGWVWSVAFSPDGERLASGGADRTVRLWTTRAAAIATALTSHVERNLTLREWAQFVGEGIPYEKTRDALPGPVTGGRP